MIPLAYPIVSTTGEMISEIPIKAGQVFYASFAGYQRCAFSDSSFVSDRTEVALIIRLPEIWGEDVDEWNPDRFLRIETAKQPASVGVFANL